MTAKQAMGDTLMAISALTERSARALISNDKNSRDELMCCIRAISGILHTGAIFVHSDDVLKVAKEKLERGLFLTQIRVSDELNDIKNNKHEHYNRENMEGQVRRIYD